MSARLETWTEIVRESQRVGLSMSPGERPEQFAMRVRQASMPSPDLSPTASSATPPAPAEASPNASRPTFEQCVHRDPAGSIVALQFPHGFVMPVPVDWMDVLADLRERRGWNAVEIADAIGWKPDSVRKLATRAGQSPKAENAMTLWLFHMLAPAKTTTTTEDTPA